MKHNRNIYIMYLITLLQGMVFYGPIATLYRQSSGLTVFHITIIESISLALCVILEMPWGIVADKIGYRKSMIFCCCLYFVSKLVFWQADGFSGFLLERLLLSVIIAGLSGLDTSILYLSCESSQSQRVFGVYNSLNTAGMIFAAGVYSFIVKDNYRLAGLLTAVSYGIAALFVFALTEVKDTAAHSTHTAAEFGSILKSLLQNRGLLMFLLATALLNESHQTITVFLNQLQYVRCGLSNTMIARIYIMVQILGLIGGLSACLTRRLGIRTSGSLYFTAGILACVTLMFTRSALLSVMAIMLLRAAFSLYQPFQTKLQNLQVTSPNRATALSVNAVLIDGVAIATNMIFGRIADIRLSAAMAAGALFCLSGLILFLAWYRHYSRQGYCSLSEQ